MFIQIFELIKRFMIGTSAVALFSALAAPTITGQSLLISNRDANSEESIPTLQATTNTSLNWSGYAATDGYFTGVSGTWTVPKVTAAETGNISADAAWVGIGGVESRDLIQAGTQAIVLESGRVTYQAWYELLPEVSHPIPLSVRPGDSVTATLNESGLGTWQLSFSNNTTDRIYVTTLSYRSSHSSAEWMEEMPSTIGGNLIPLNNFGSIKFESGWTIMDDKQTNIADSGAEAVSMSDGMGNIISAPSVLENDGSGFTIVQSPAPQTASSRRVRFEFSGF